MLRSETKVSFVWLFQTWVKAMYGMKPKTIITDQCPSMRIAIKEVFPNAVHRCCQWHVMRKASDHLGALYNLKEKEGFEDDLKWVINRSMTVPEFEEGWRNMLVKHDLRNNRHLKNMYESRSEWVPAYFRDVFCANMSTSQRSESANASLKIWTNNHSSMYKLALNVEKIVEGIWANESDEDIATMKKVPKLSTLYLMEKDAYQVYTAKIMSIFKDNLRLSQLGEVNELEKDNLYEVTIKEHPTIEKWIPVTYTVKVDKLEEFVSCSCKGYEYDGLLCSHAIKVMHHVNLFHLPKRYIMKRWCKDANASVKRSHVERSIEFGSTQEQAAIRVATLKPRLKRILDIASISSDAFIQFQGLLDMVEQQMEQHVVVQQMEQHVSEQEPITCEDATPSNGVLDPPISQCKGKRKQPQRLKPPSEAKKPRKCGICGSKKGGHNARTCPLKKNKEKDMEDDYANSGPEDEEYEDLSS
ncbi:Protein FAR1-RELATED SEQUENCE 5 [Rhynchospora pubera]|uniref:Protein FAR1-RELATED SEQUENCE n=1 Tax=Rhynchospora pubera TaxID=906938 RepID=A0AAV8HPP8_9POAL|nr:Protein FAR1-RELATED SEQUENCE 5 [Rhynchospora pubera]